MTDTSARPHRVPDAAAHQKIAHALVSRSIPDKTSGAPSGSSGSATSRVPMLDATRFIAAAGVVWVHSITPGSPTEIMHGLGTFGVPFYIFAAVYFMTRSMYRDPAKSLASYSAGRLYRVYLPFLAWCVIYLAMSNVIAMISPADHPHEYPHWYHLYVGTKNHLWFLPYMVMLCIGGAVLVKMIRKIPALRWPTVVLLALMGAASIFLPRPAWVTLDPTQPMYPESDFWVPFFRILPVPFWGLALALAWAPSGRKLTTNTTVALVGVATVLTSVSMQWVIGLFHTEFQDMTQSQIMLERLLRGGAGVGCILMATAPWRNWFITGMASLGRYSYGIYLSHILILRLITFKLDRILGQHPVTHDVVSFVLAMPLATLFSMAMARFRVTRWMMGE